MTPLFTPLLSPSACCPEHLPTLALGYMHRSFSKRRSTAPLTRPNKVWFVFSKVHMRLQTAPCQRPLEMPPVFVSSKIFYNPIQSCCLAPSGTPKLRGNFISTRQVRLALQYLGNVSFRCVILRWQKNECRPLKGGSAKVECLGPDMARN